MSEQEQTNAFANEIDKLVDRFRDEYDLTFASAVGVLQMKIHLLCNEAAGMDAGDEEEDDAGDDDRTLE